MVRNLVVAAIVTAIAVIVFCAITINDRQSPPGSADRPASIPSAEAAEPAYETLEASEEAEDQETPAATEQDKDAPPADAARSEGEDPPAPQGGGDAPTSAGSAAVERAAKAQKYLFILFYKSEDEQTRTIRQGLDALMEKVGDRADSIVIATVDPTEKEIVAKFNLSRAPMPLVLALAPNGVVTGAVHGEFSEERLLAAFAGPGKQACLKALQQRKLVFLCVQNESTKSNAAAMQGVRDFKADARFAKFTEIVMLDPADAAEAKFIGELRIDPKTAEAITVFLAPPGMAIAQFRGPTNKDGLLATLQKASSGCGTGGCGPSDCGPQK